MPHFDHKCEASSSRDSRATLSDSYSFADPRKQCNVGDVPCQVILGDEYCREMDLSMFLMPEVIRMFAMWLSLNRAVLH